MFDDKIRAARTQLAALETDLELLGKTALQMSSELHTMQDRLWGLLEDEARAGAEPIDAEKSLSFAPAQDDEGRWYVEFANGEKEYHDPAIHSATRSVTPAGRFRRRRTLHKPASAPEAPEAPPEPENGSDGAEQAQAGVSAADTGPPPVPAVVSMKQYISAAENADAVHVFVKLSGEHAEAGYYTYAELADIEQSAEKRLKTLEGRS